METLRRLRGRRKSKGQADKASITSVATVDGNTSGRGVRTPDPLGERLSTTTPASRDRARETTSQEYNHQVSGDGYTSSSARGPVQPALVAISRPSVSQHRPGTSGSLQAAVSHAADSASRSHEKSFNSVSSSPRNRTLPARHVDIFTGTGNNNGPMRTFNEDVAERNLDAVRAALQGVEQRYVPSSKYQEEVASRNVYSSALVRAYDLSRDPFPRLDVNDLSYRNKPLPPLKGFHANHPPQTSTEHTRPSTYDPRSHRSRHYSSRNRDGSGQPPLTPPERRTDETTDERVVQAEQSMEEERSKWLQEKRHREATTAVATVVSPVQQVNGSVPGRPSAATTENTRRLHTTWEDFARHQPLSRDRSSANEGPPTADRPDHVRYHDVRRSGSAVGNASLTKISNTVKGRMVMDLTGDDLDFFSESSDDSSDTAQVEETRPDRLHRRQPAVVGAAPSVVRENPEGQQHHDPDSLGGRRSQSQRPHPSFQKVQDWISEEWESEASVAVHTRPSQARQPGRSLTPAPSLGFSPISTVASTSPRASTLFPEPTVRMSRAAVTSAPPRSGANPPTAVHASTTYPISSVRTGEAGSPVSKSQFRLPGAKVSASADSQDIESRARSATGPTKNKVHFNQAPEDHFAPGLTLVESHSNSPNTSPRQKVPETVLSRGSTSPSVTTGVKTRDFATEARNRAVTKEVPAGEKKSQPGGGGADKKKKDRPVSVFDEEGFARKQAEARAALIRLQKSLEEDFSLPAPKTSSRTPKMDGSGQDFSFEDEGPVARSSKPAPVKRREQHRDVSNRSNTVPVESFIPISSSRDSRYVGRPSDPSLWNMENTASSSKIPARTTSNTSKLRSTGPRPGRMPTPNGVGGNPVHPLLARIDDVMRPPPSPGEISLSHFPIPTPRTMSPETNKVDSSSDTPRRGSVRSQNSIVSVFNIPSHMVPGRGSSLRDRLVAEQGNLEWD